MIAKNDKDFQRLVTERDGYICHYCNKNLSLPYYFNAEGVNQYAVAHHIKRKRAHPELRLETDNGQTVCAQCHNLIHSGLIKEKK